MRIALISDLHGNLVALEAVIAEIERDNIDQVICLGDIADLGPAPAETVDRLRELGYPTILGNHDPFGDESYGHPMVMAITEWCKSQLSEEHLHYLRGLPREHTIDFGAGRTLQCVHGSPRSYDEGLTTSLSDTQLGELLNGTQADVLCAGHTHVQMVRHLGTQTIVNVGSVGMPYEFVFDGKPPRVLPWAEYAVIQTRATSIGVELRRTAYDVARFVASIHASSLPNGEFWASQWTRVLTGR